MTMFRPAACAFALIALAGARTMHAQSGTPSPDSAVVTPATAPVPQVHPKLCFRGQALPKCRAFFLTEVGFYARAAGTSRSYTEPTVNGTQVTRRLRDLDSHLSWDLGYMTNLDIAHAAGGTVMLGTGDAGIRMAAKGRYRWWLDGGRGVVDISAGVLSAGVRNPERQNTARGVGLTAEVASGLGDYFALTARADVLRADDRNVAAVYGGLRLGSYPAIVANVVGGTLLILLVRAISGVDY